MSRVIYTRDKFRKGPESGTRERKGRRRMHSTIFPWIFSWLAFPPVVGSPHLKGHKLRATYGDTKDNPRGPRRPFARKILWQAWTVTFKAAAGPILKGLVCIKLCVASGRTTNYNIWLAIAAGANAYCPPVGEKFLRRVAMPWVETTESSINMFEIILSWSKKLKRIHHTRWKQTTSFCHELKCNVNQFIWHDPHASIVNI